MEKAMTEAIVIGLSVAMVAGVGSWVVGKTRSQQESSNKAIDQVANETAAMIDSNVTALQGKTVLGSEVLSDIAQAQTSTSLYIGVKNLKGTQTFYVYKSASIDPDQLQTTSEFAKALAAAKTPSDTEHYINPTAKFTVSAEQHKGLVYDDNNNLIGVLFEQVE